MVLYTQVTNRGTITQGYLHVSIPHTLCLVPFPQNYPLLLTLLLVRSSLRIINPSALRILVPHSEARKSRKVGTTG
jgi:hypothetical protein